MSGGTDAFRSVHLETLGFAGERNAIGAFDLAQAGGPLSPLSGSRRLAIAAIAALHNPATLIPEAPRTPTIWKSFRSINVHQNVAAWTPAAGKKFRVQAFRFGIPGNSTLAVATGVEFNLLDGGAVIFAGAFTGWNVFIPAAAPANPLGALFESGWIVFPGNGYLSSAANNVFGFQGNAGAALTAGFAGGLVLGTEE